METETTTTIDETEIRFDLKSVLTPEEIARFKEAAKAANAKSLTDHFVNLTLRIQSAA